MPSQRLNLLASLAAMDLVCEICQRHFAALSDIKVDHDHQSGAARGLLCNQCNLMLGICHDDPQRLHRAALYLRGKKRHLANTQTELDDKTIRLAERRARIRYRAGDRQVTAEDVALLLQLTVGDVNKLARLSRTFPFPYRHWIKNDVQKWMTENQGELDQFRERCEQGRINKLQLTS